MRVVERARSRGVAAAGILLGGVFLCAWGAVPGGTFQDDDLVGPLGLAGAWRIRPLLRLTFTLQEALHGHRADLLLAGNLALLAVTAAGVGALAARRLGPLAALLAVAAFVLQPAHAEAVAYVSGRSAGLMAALAVWCVWTHLRAVDAGDARARWRWSAVSCGLLVLAALSKEVALVVPLLAWLASRWHAPERPARTGPLLATAACLALGLALAFPRYRELGAWSLALRGPAAALSTHLSALPAQLSLWLRPGALSVVHAPGDGWVAPWVGGALVLAATGTAWALRRRAPTACFAIAWTLLALVPTHGIVARADVVTERSLHLAWVGPALGLGAALTWLARRLRSVPARALLGAAVAAMSLLATFAVRARVHIWSDPRALWTEAVARAPASPRAWNNLGLVLLDEEPDAAARALRQAARLAPDDPRLAFTLAVLESRCTLDPPAP